MREGWSSENEFKSLPKTCIIVPISLPELDCNKKGFKDPRGRGFK
jgi:hypothetical protein